MESSDNRVNRANSVGVIDLHSTSTTIAVVVIFSSSQTFNFFEVRSSDCDIVPNSSMTLHTNAHFTIINLPLIFKLILNLFHNHFVRRERTMITLAKKIFGKLLFVHNFVLYLFTSAVTLALRKCFTQTSGALGYFETLCDWKVGSRTVVVDEWRRWSVILLDEKTRCSNKGNRDKMSVSAFKRWVLISESIVVLNSSLLSSEAVVNSFSSSSEICNRVRELL